MMATSLVMSVLLCRRRVRPERRRKAYTNCNYYSNVVPVIEHKPTFCRICEPLCGMIATVEDGRLVSLRPDKEHPLSAGFACQKGIAFTEVNNDPDRVTQPLRRTAAGEFEPVRWECGDVRHRRAARRPSSPSTAPAPSAGTSATRGPSATRICCGRGSSSRTRPRHPLLHGVLAGHQCPFLASQLLYGTPTSMPIPDVRRTDLLVMMGANPVVSHGSVLTAPRIKERMHDVVKRGGTRRRHRPAPVRDGRTVRVARHRPRQRRLLPAVAAAGDVRRGPRRPRRGRRTRRRAGLAPGPMRTVHPRGHPAAHRRRARRGAWACPRSGRHPAGGRLRPARHQRRPERHADNLFDRCGQHRRG